MEFQFSFSTTIITFLIFLIFLCKLVFQFKRAKSEPTNKKLPPGPWKLPVIGNLHHFIGDSSSLPHHVLRELAKKHGDLMQVQLGKMSMVVVSSPKIAMEVMKTHDLAFAHRPEPFTAKIVPNIGRDIALAPYGDYWRQMKKLSTLKLLSDKRVRSFSSLREEEVSNLIESINLSADSVINLTEKILAFTSSMICRAAFGSTCKCQVEFVRFTHEIVSLAGGFGLLEMFPSLKFLQVINGMKAKVVKIHEEVYKILENIIDEHREKATTITSTQQHVKDELENEDFVDVLLRIQKSDSLEVPITNEDIKAVIWGLFVGGTDTSSATIIWAMAEMMRNPRMMEKAQAEVREMFKGKKRIHEIDDQELSYLKLLIKETLRLHPPGPLLLPRECRERCEINGYEIPIKTKVLVNAWAIGRDPEYWKDAESFIPERFGKRCIDFKGTNFEYIPFGGGRRLCPGMSFGVANIELPLAQLLYHFNWKLPNGIQPEELDMSESFGAIVKRKKDLYLVATPYIPPGQKN
ncbi:hypothetical protein ACOSQ2_016106 [Xanthoceras sorbifolium]